MPFKPVQFPQHIPARDNRIGYDLNLINPSTGTYCYVDENGIIWETRNTNDSRFSISVGHLDN